VKGAKAKRPGRWKLVFKIAPQRGTKIHTLGRAGQKRGKANSHDCDKSTIGHKERERGARRVLEGTKSWERENILGVHRGVLS